MCDLAALAGSLSPQLQHLTAAMMAGFPILMGAGALHSVGLMFVGNRPACGQPSGAASVMTRGMVILAITIFAGSGGLSKLNLGNLASQGPATVGAVAPAPFADSLPGSSFALPGFNVASGMGSGIYAQALDYSTLNGGRR